MKTLYLQERVVLGEQDPFQCFRLGEEQDENGLLVVNRVEAVAQHRRRWVRQEGVFVHLEPRRVKQPLERIFGQC